LKEGGGLGMQSDIFIKKLIEGADELGVKLDESKARAFLIYAEALREWNEKINLTSLTDIESILQKHFLDSLSIAPYIKEDAFAADVGTGAGFPGIPVKIALPGVRLTLMDSTKKKLTFVDYIIQKLDLKNAKTVHIRAEEAGREKSFREKYDAVMSRAVARMDILAEYCLPLVKPNGVFIAMKGPNIKEELASAVEGMERVGGRVWKCEFIKIDGGVNNEIIERNIIITEKFRQTSAKYPRTSLELTKIYKKDAEKI
jgi:16S rRNA (guanine527-N7)-methyltransferase